MSIKKRSSAKFRLQLLDIMDQKHHWAWPQFVGPFMSKRQLKIHFQQEYASYVRDFPVYLARIHGQNPPLEARKMLAENIYEEDTGMLSLGTSHPELFMRMMEGLGFRSREFEKIRLLPATQRYRSWLERISHGSDWVLGAAVLTIFVEGSVNDRQELFHPVTSKTSRHILEKIKHHPLVQHQGVSPQAMDLIRAHQMVETGHRHDAYAMVTHYAGSRSHQDKILAAVKHTLDLWLRYRDGVARACGLQKNKSEIR
ncbi:MAG: iron-containing redox enzyme family protein [Nitrospirales bacterium]|nr:iron-containing redox enzyme family protein [Nitrospirales bacterium]MDR4484334.1 iron-containing redox enzyme family protein [Nitrospirales bacterium]MDR4484643.1 iron-containing redox enzyme family protein [Nitrospirales bacterium]